MLALFVAFRLIFWTVQVTEVENHPCDEWLTLERSAFNLFTVAQFTLSTQLINTKFCVSLPHRRSITVSLETNPLLCQVTVGCAIFLRLLTVEENELGFA